MSEEKYKKICEEFGGKYVNKNKCLIDGFPLALEEADYLYDYRPESQMRVTVHPRLFLSKVPYKPLSDKHVNELADKMKRKTPIDPAFIDVTTKGEIIGHEGRHRAKATDKLGMDKFPVIFYCRDEETHEYVPKEECMEVFKKLLRILNI